MTDIYVGKLFRTEGEVYVRAHQFKPDRFSRSKTVISPRFRVVKITDTHFFVAVVGDEEWGRRLGLSDSSRQAWGPWLLPLTPLEQLAEAAE